MMMSIAVALFVTGIVFLLDGFVVTERAEQLANAALALFVAALGTLTGEALSHVARIIVVTR